MEDEVEERVAKYHMLVTNAAFFSRAANNYSQIPTIMEEISAIHDILPYVRSGVFPVPDKVVYSYGFKFYYPTFVLKRPIRKQDIEKGLWKLVHINTDMMTGRDKINFVFPRDLESIFKQK